MAYQPQQRPGCHRPNYPAYGMPMPMQPVAPASCPMPREEMKVSKPCPCQEKKKDNGMDIDRYPVGMCYVPWQNFNTTYDLNKALKSGTIFPELDLKFTGRCSR